MTQQEHLFMLSLYAMQSTKYNLLVEILKTRGVLEDDDIQAFRAHVVSETQEHREWFREAWKAYQVTAASLGLTTGLENFLPPDMKA
jgi:hypothetical protein